MFNNEEVKEHGKHLASWKILKWIAWRYGNSDRYFITGVRIVFLGIKWVANDSFTAKIIEQSDCLEYSVPLAGVIARIAIVPTMPYQVKKLHECYYFSIVHLYLPNPMAHLASLVLPRSVKRVVN